MTTKKQTMYMINGLAMVVLLAAVSGCGPKAARFTQQPTVESTAKVVFLDQRLNNDLRVEELGATEPDTSRLLVKLKIMNLRDKPIECRIKYKFKDADGFTVDETSWMPVVFDRLEVTGLQQRSLSVDATDFTVLVRYEKAIKGMTD